MFEANGLCIGEIAIDNAEPVDKKIDRQVKESLNLSFDIASQSDKQMALNQSKKLNQGALGLLTRQKIKDECSAKAETQKLLEHQAETASVKSTGQAIAEAKAKAMAAQIKGEAEVQEAELVARALQIRRYAELELKQQKNKAELDHTQALNAFECEKESKLSSIEVDKFKGTIDAIGPQTIVAMARAGPETQAKMMAGLGLKGFMIMDGKNPVNLFNTAGSMLGGELQPQDVAQM